MGSSHMAMTTNHRYATPTERETGAGTVVPPVAAHSSASNRGLTFRNSSAGRVIADGRAVRGTKSSAATP
jgi:hypothetical protein